MVLPKGNRRSFGPPRTLSLTLIGLVFVLLAGPAGALAARSPGASSPGAPTAVATSTATLLQEAVQSLSTGAGPAFGVATTCHAQSSVTATCSSPPAPRAVHAQNASAEIWQNATPGANFFGGPAAGESGSMAWDPEESSILYFGGCTYTSCPDNQTWLYYFGTWYNETNYSDAPPATYGAAMDYDSWFPGIVMFGGCSIVCPDDYTYWYNDGTWDNVSYFSTATPAPRFDASMVFLNDSSDNVTMLFGGNDNGFLLNDTWEWQGFSGWVELFPSTAPSPRDYFSMAFYPAVGQAVLFGGCTYSTCSLNDTWGFDSGTWTNYTPSFPILGFPNPPGRGLASMTYDGALGGLVLVDGVNDFQYLNDTWLYTCPFFCGWTNVTAAGTDLLPVYDAAMASDSSVDAPILFGGQVFNGTAYPLQNSTWVYEPQFSIAPTILPATGPARALINATLNAQGGTFPYYTAWTALGTSLYGDNLTFYFSNPGDYELNITSYDSYGVLQTAQLTADETGVSALAEASATTTDVGVPVNFSSPAATGGTPLYTYNWSWDDGSSNGTGLNASHAFAAAGSYTVTLEVTDALGLTNTTSVSITVVAAPTVSFSPSSASADVGASITFTATVSGGTTPYTYSWNFGDHTTTSTVASPSHSFASTGSYVVWLNVTDADGLVASSNVTVTVVAALTATATDLPTSGVTGETLNFTSTASGGQSPYTYSWVFGDGQRSTAGTTTHAYASAGTYTVKVWTNDSAGGTTLNTLTVTITAASGGGGGNQNTSSTNPLGGSTLWIIIAIIVILVIVGVAYMMMRGRKGGGSTAPPSGASGGMEPPAGASGAPPAPPPGGAPPS